MRRLACMHVLILAGGITGCNRGELISGVSDSTYVATMAELRRLQRPGRDSAQGAAARDSVLRRRGLTPAQLERASAALAEDPDRAVALWQRIESRAADTVATPPKGSAP